MSQFIIETLKGGAAVVHRLPCFCLFLLFLRTTNGEMQGGLLK